MHLAHETAVIAANTGTSTRAHFVARCARLLPAYAGTELYCLMTEENEQLERGRTRQCSGWD